MKIQAIGLFNNRLNFHKRKDNINFNKLGALPFDSFTFRGEQAPFYIIKPDKSYKKYDEPRAAARDINISEYVISACLAGRTRAIQREYLAFYASDLETKDEATNESYLDVDKFNSKFDEYKRFFRTKTPVYLARVSDGELTRFDDINDVTRTLYISRDCINANLKGRTRMVGGYFAFYAADLETKDEDGNTIFNQEKFDTEFNRMKQAFVEKKDPAVYLYDLESKSIKRFENVIEAAHQLSTSRDNVMACIKGKMKTTCNHVAFFADDLEIKDEDGNPIFNQEKLDEKLCERFPN